MTDKKDFKDVPITQRCCKCCGEVKPIDDFYKTSGGRSWRHRCKPCETGRRSTYFKEYHSKNYKSKGTAGRGRPRKTPKPTEQKQENETDNKE